ncbi:MAG TPA: carbon-nitrogen hydrolase family protein [Ancylobacter sp.]
MIVLPKIAAVSIGPAGDDRLPLWIEAEAGIAAAARAGAMLAVLPELFALPYVAGDDPVRWLRLAETMAGATVTRMRDAACRSGVAVVFGIALMTQGNLPLNAAVLVRPDGTATCVASKIHLPPADPADIFGEADHFSPGPASVSAFQIGSLRVAVLICYDRRFPECWRAAAAAGADIVVVLVGGPAPTDPDGLFAAELRTHARANAVYALAASRYGTETILGRTMRHDGDSLAIDPHGNMMAVAPHAAPGLAMAVIDLTRLTEARAQNATARRLRLSA